MKKLVFICCSLLLVVCSYAKSNVDSGYVLPFRIESFTASVDINKSVSLNFTVAETFSVVTHYEIWRSFNGIDFELLGNVNKTNNAPINHYYSFIDQSNRNNGASIVYYRLRQVTSGNGETYSHILSVKLKNSETDITMWPMPFVNTLNISFTSDKDNDEVYVLVAESTGKQIQVQKLICMKGLKTYQLNGLETLAKGSYLITIKTKTKTIGTKIITKN
jgi:hypothetical protein